MKCDKGTEVGESRLGAINVSGDQLNATYADLHKLKKTFRKTEKSYDATPRKHPKK